ncbi:hypothetical protein ACFRMQ_31120 [Kitasatospora sp. NPDC056783]|uniref:hypothetical protein n=1 Tax=Kitasatospora sp. NPDC056783 TaxID=3345943 RepID=UPI0036AA71B0
MLEPTGRRGELLPQVVPAKTAWLVAGAWTGVQIQSRKMSGRADLERRAAVLYQHLMPSIAVPGVPAALDLGVDRGVPAAAEPAVVTRARAGGVGEGGSALEEAGADEVASS